MSLPVLDTAPLRAVGMFPLLELELGGSFPLNLIGTGGVGWDEGGAGEGPYGGGVGPVQVSELEAVLDADVVRWSTQDLATSRGMFDGVLLDWPEIVLDQALGLIAQVTVRARNDDGRFNAWITRASGDYRGKLATMHFIVTDPTTPAFREVSLDLDRFTGSLEHVEAGDSPRSVSLIFTTNDPRATEALLPSRVCTTATFPNAPVSFPVTGGLGSTLAVGSGLGRNVPCRLVGAPASDDELSIYEIAPGMGTPAFHAIRIDGAKQFPGADYVIKPRLYRDNGRPVALAQLFRPITGPITADVEARFPDVRPSTRSTYCWSDGFWDWIGGRHAVSATLTTGDLVTGRGGQGTGAVRLSLPEHTLTLPNVGADASGTAVRELELFVGEGAPAAQRIIDFGAVLLVEDDGDLTVTITTSDDTATLTGTAARDAYHTIRVTIDGSDVRLDVDGVGVDSDTVTGIPAWSTDATVGEAGAEKLFDLGWVHLDSTPLDASDALHTHYALIKSPVEALRLMAAEAGELSDESTFATVAAALAAAGDGSGLQADGWFVNAIDMASLYALFGVFRELRVSRDTLGVLTFAAYTEATEVRLAVGVGPPLSNALQVRHGRRSGAETAPMLPIHYRQQRGADGQVLRGNGVLGEYQHRTEAFTALPGRTPYPPLECPLIDSHRTADMVRDWQEKILRVEDEGLELLLNHEARDVRQNDLLRVSIDGGDVTEVDFRVRGGTHAITSVQATLRRYDARLFEYSARPLPQDPIPSTRAFLDLGDEQDIAATVDGSDVALELGCFRVHEAPADLVLPTTISTVVAVDADTREAALTSAQGYLYSPGELVDVRMGTPTTAVDTTRPIDRLGFTVSVRTVCAPTTLYLLWKLSAGAYAPSGVQPNPFAYDSNDVATAWTGYLTENPFTTEARPWSVDDISRIAGRVFCQPGTDYFFESWHFQVWQLIDAPSNLGRVLWWRHATPTSPSELTPTSLRGGTSFLMDDVGVPAGTYYYTARVYDSFDRLTLTVVSDAVVVA